LLEFGVAPAKNTAWFLKAFDNVCLCHGNDSSSSLNCVQLYGFYTSVAAPVSSYLFFSTCGDDFSSLAPKVVGVPQSSPFFFVYWWHDRCSRFLEISYVSLMICKFTTSGEGKCSHCVLGRWTIICVWFLSDLVLIFWFWILAKSIYFHSERMCIFCTYYLQVCLSKEVFWTHFLCVQLKFGVFFCWLKWFFDWYASYFSWWPGVDLFIYLNL
jgi:hypothetical protein